MPMLLRANPRDAPLFDTCGGITVHAALCAVGRDNGDYVFTPFGHLADGNPYDAYLPPNPDDPKGFIRPDAQGDAP